MSSPVIRSPSGTVSDLVGWKQILDVVIGDYERGESHVLNTYSFPFGNIVAAYESTGIGPGGVALGIEAAAEALGVPSDIVVSGDGNLEGTSDKDIFYLDAGNEVARGGQDYDVYVVGKNFGQDVIDDVEPPLAVSGNGTSDALRILRQFEGRLPRLFGGAQVDRGGQRAGATRFESSEWQMYDFSIPFCVCLICGFCRSGPELEVA